MLIQSIMRKVVQSRVGGQFRLYPPPRGVVVVGNPRINAMAQLSTTLGTASSMLNLRKDQVEKDLSILNKISSLTFKERHESLRDVHVAGTGRWILDDKKFQGWIESRKKKASVLWCYGIGSSV